MEGFAGLGEGNGCGRAVNEHRRLRNRLTFFPPASGKDGQNYEDKMDISHGVLLPTGKTDIIMPEFATWEVPKLLIQFACLFGQNTKWKCHSDFGVLSNLLIQ